MPALDRFLSDWEHLIGALGPYYGGRGLFGPRERQHEGEGLLGPSAASNGILLRMALINLYNDTLPLACA